MSGKVSHSIWPDVILCYIHTTYAWSSVIYIQHWQILGFFLLMPFNLSSVICPYLSVKCCIICIPSSSDSFILADCLFFFHVQLFSAVFPPLYPSLPASVVIDSMHRPRPSVPRPFQPCPMRFVNIPPPSVIPFLILIFYLLWFLNNTQRAMVSFYFVNSWLWRQN